MAVMSVVSVVLLSHVATQASAFADIFPHGLQGAALRSSASAAAPVVAHPAQAAALPQPVALRGSDVVAFEEPASLAQDGFSNLKGAAFAGVLAALCLGARSLRRMSGISRESRITMHYGAHKRTIVPGPRGVREGIEGAESRGNSYKPWVALRRQSKRDLRYWKQRQILAESGITQCKGGFKKWWPNRNTHNFYHGPKSHPDNPWFPAPNTGYDKAAMGPIPEKYRAVSVHQDSGLSLFSSGAAQPAAASSTFVAGRGAFVAASASMKRFGIGASACARPALVIMKAHKKAASSTKNQGHKCNSKAYGIRPQAMKGMKVKGSQVLLKQKGYTWYPGANVVKGKDFTLNSLKEGVAMWRGPKNTRILGLKEGSGKEVFVVPWDFIEEKCDKVGYKHELGHFAPKKYEPWMRPSIHQPETVRNRLAEMREEWLQSEEGKAALAKKEEKEKKQKEFNTKTWAKLKAKKVAKMKKEGTYSPREAVKAQS